MNNYFFSVYFLIFLINILIILNLDFFARIINIYDFPDKLRKFHKKKIPLLGGFLLILNIVLFFIFFWKDIISIYNYKNIILINSYFFLFSFAFSLLFLFFVGVYDDKYSIRPIIKIFLFLFIFYIFINFDPSLFLSKIKFSFLSDHFILGKSAIYLSVACLLFANISQNMFDGVNLQTGVFYLLISLFFIYKNIVPEFFFIISLVLIIFIYKNYKNEIFLGDSGVYILSFVTSFAFIKSSQMFDNLFADEIFAYLFLPSVDSIRVCFYRLIIGKSIFLPDRNHFHHILLNSINEKYYYLIVISFLMFPFLWINLFSYSIVYLIIIQFIIYFLLLFFFKKNLKN